MAVGNVKYKNSIPRRTRNLKACKKSSSTTTTTIINSSNTTETSSNNSATTLLISRSAKSGSGKSIVRPPAAATTTTIKTTKTSTCSVDNIVNESHRSRSRDGRSLMPRPVLTLILIILVNSLSFGITAVIDGGKRNDSFNSMTSTTITSSSSSSSFQDKSTNSKPQHNSIRVERSAALDITGFRLEESKHEVKSYNGIPSVLSNNEVTVRVFGSGITQDTVIAFTGESNTYGSSCLFPSTKLFKAEPGTATGTTALFQVILPKQESQFFICAKIDPHPDLKNATDTIPLVHQGDNQWNQIYSHENLLPLWASIMIIAICLCFSALFSGLNLGLMSLDRTELKILRNTGTPEEREYAKKIQPVRDQGNFLLCSILLGNVLVNSTFTILLDSLTSGLVAVACSTIAIVIFGEITPQAICSRHGLAVGAKTIYITKVVMVLTSPLAWPTSKILDRILGEEIGNVYNRERLKELVKVTTGINDLDNTEVNIISGALEMHKKTVSDVLTHIDDVYMLPLDAVLGFETVSEIMKSGYSRIPVYDGNKRNIVTLLYIKDLAFVDPDDNTPLKTLCEFYQNPVHFVFEDTTLDVMFNQFKDGTTGHMAFVHRVNNEGDGDPFYETIGLVTLEDVIEELIQAEIVDETDVIIDNRTKQRRSRYKKQDFTAFAERRDNQTVHISPQLTLATFQYLSTSVDAFKSDSISESILRRLLNQDIVHTIKLKGKDKKDPSLFIFQQGKAVDFFVLILEGRVEVTVGKENLLFESGPFTYFGIQALSQNVVTESPSIVGFRDSLQSLNMDAKIRQTFIPDYSVRASSDVTYIAIKRNLYMTAKKATLLERTRRSGADQGNDIIDEDVARLLHSLHDDDKYTHDNQSPRKAYNGGSSIASQSLNDLSQPSRVFAMSANNSLQQHSPGGDSADIIDEVSLTSQVTSDPANALIPINPNNTDNTDIDKHDAASIPLLPVSNAHNSAITK